MLEFSFANNGGRLGSPVEGLGKGTADAFDVGVVYEEGTPVEFKRHDASIL